MGRQITLHIASVGTCPQNHPNHRIFVPIAPSSTTTSIFGPCWRLIARCNSATTSAPTPSATKKPLLHWMRTPDLTDVCFTGKENVSPSSRTVCCRPPRGLYSSPSRLTKSTSFLAMKSKSSSLVPNMSILGIGTSSYSCFSTLPSLPPRRQRRTRKLVPPKSKA